MKVLYPQLGESNIEVLGSTPEKWFRKVDKNGDLKIDANELAEHLKKLAFSLNKTFFTKIQSKYEAYIKQNPIKPDLSV